MVDMSMITLAEFEKVRADLAGHVDVLIQHSENYYVICREAVNREPEPGGRAFNLIRRAVGHEIVSRLYRLIEGISGGSHFPSMMKQLADDSLLDQIMPVFNYDGRKSLNELILLRDEVLRTFDDISASDEFAKTQIYRHRFVAHRLSQPRDLKRLPPSADVTELSSKELRWLTDSLADIVGKVAYMMNRGGFPAADIAQMAQDEAHELWGLEPPKRSSVMDYLVPEGE